MASSQVMASSSPPNPDQPRQQHYPSPVLTPTDNNHLHHPDHLHNSRGGFVEAPTTTNNNNIMDDLFKNIYSDSDADNTDGMGNNNNRTVDDVWRDIVAGEPPPPAAAEMTLEVFLAKNGVGNDEDLRVPAPLPPPPPPPPVIGGFGVETAVMGPITGGVQFVNNNVIGGRGKRRGAPVEEAPLDKATQQKQRRMIKNRESAARSRERKQAYTVELESLVTQLEEDNARILREEAETNKERYNMLMENIIPVAEKRRPRRELRRTRSMEW